MARHNPRRIFRKRPSPTVVGIAWYDPTQWAKLKQVAADAEKMDATQEAWQRGFERTERELAARGLTVRRVPIDVDALVAWCGAQNKPVNGEARAEYTSQIISGRISS